MRCLSASKPCLSCRPCAHVCRGARARRACWQAWACRRWACQPRPRPSARGCTASALWPCRRSSSARRAPSCASWSSRVRPALSDWLCTAMPVLCGMLLRPQWVPAVVVQIFSMAAVSAITNRSSCLMLRPGCREAGCCKKSPRSTAGKLQAARFVVNLRLLIRCAWRQARSCCASRWRRLQRRLRLLRWMRLRRARPRPLCQSLQMTQVAQPSQGPQRRRQRSWTRARAREAGQPGLVQRGRLRQWARAGARAPAAQRLTRANCRGCNFSFCWPAYRFVVLACRAGYVVCCHAHCTLLCVPAAQLQRGRRRAVAGHVCSALPAATQTP